MFDLNPRIHLHEVIIPIAVKEKFHGTGGSIFNRFGGFHCGLTDFFAQLGSHNWRRSFFNEFLVTSLDRAVPLSKMNRFPFAVSKNLDFDMMRILDKSFDIQRVIFEARLRFGARHLESGLQRGHVAHNPHAAPSPTGNRFNYQRQFHLLCKNSGIFRVRNRSVRTRSHRTTGGNHHSFRFGFVSH